MPTIKEMIRQQRDAHPGAGKVVGCSYVLDSSLGSGGFGCVWKAKDRHSKDHGFVAIKFLGGFKAKDESAIASLKNEFAILKDLNHPHINKVYDFGRDPKFGQYIVTEFVDGLQLQKAVAERDTDFCEAMIVQVLRALAYIHSRGVFHFDIKPPNIIVKNNDHAVLIDFGIAALRPSEKAVGSLGFMAPEMLMNQRPDGRADLYSVGVLFYSILIGENPFNSMSFEEAKEKHLKLNVPPPSKVKPNIPSYFDIIVGKLLSKNPADRYQTASEALRDIVFLSQNKYNVETAETMTAYLPIEGRLIGRNEERRLAHALVDDLMQGQKSFIACITGDAGIGKSRLLKDIRYHALLAGCRVVYVDAMTPIDEGMQEIANMVSLSSTMATPAIISIDGLSRFTKARPDVWTLINACTHQIKDSAFLQGLGFVYTDTMPDETIQGGQTAISLKNFSSGEIAEYIETIVKAEDKHIKNIAHEIMSYTRGNPALVTTYCSKLVEQGFLLDKSGRWDDALFRNINIDFKTIDVPGLLVKSFLDALENLSEEEMHILECLSVLDGKAVESVVFEMMSRPQNFYASLTALGRRHFIVRDVLEKTCDIIDEFTRNAILGAIDEAVVRKWHDMIAEHLLSKHCPHDDLNCQQCAEINMHVAYCSDIKKAHSAIMKLVRYGRRHGFAERAAQRLEKRLAAENDKARQYELSLELGEWWFSAGKYNNVIAMKSNDAELLDDVNFCKLIGRALMEQGKLEKAAKVFSRGIELCRRGQNKEECIINNYLAKTTLLEGKYDDAVKIYEQVRTGMKSLGTDEQSVIMADNELGEAYRLKGKYEIAIKILMNDIEYFERFKQRNIQRYYSIAETFRITARYNEAESFYITAIAAAKESQQRRMLLRLYNGYASALVASGKIAEAVEQYQSALALGYHTGDLTALATIGLNLGRCYNDVGDIKKAITFLNLTMTFLGSEKMESSWVISQQCPLFLELGDVKRKEGDFESALDFLKKALKITEGNESAALYKSWIFITWAKVCKDMGKRDEALKILKNAEKFLVNSEAKKAYSELLNQL